ncbi:MAG: alpha-glucan family phosphorylase [Smithellaceae bacterium]|nr:alpha-glucan family phosphorylase [Smithellaceae bacterium]
MDPIAKGFLFEVSWEVCNKVGGIYTVIASKAAQAVKHYGDNYFLLGPDLKTNPEFEETDEGSWQRIREATAIKEIPCRFGRWRIPGSPKVVLVNFSKKYNKDQLLYRLWEDYGVESIAGGWDYVEPVMFSHACGEVIETIYNLYARPDKAPAVAQFHEWMCGAGLLALKKKTPEIGTVFTTHATILGRSLASSGVDLYSDMTQISPQREAKAHQITAKYSMESVSAREADCFTTVSEITATEAKNILGREPDVITPNGLDMEQIPDLAGNRDKALKSKQILLAAGRRFLRKDLAPNTRIMMISGRYEFSNKGIDLFLNALGRLEKTLPEGRSLLVYLLVLGGHTDLIPSLKSDFTSPDPGNIPIATHRLNYESSDPILITCNRVGLRNTPENKINVIFIPAYLNGHDGLINLHYYEALAGCDLGVFPSYYEPWGYTPLESAAYAVPTITTDQAGFGLWVQKNFPSPRGVLILNRCKIPVQTIEDNLHNLLTDFVSWSDGELLRQRKAARQIALKANWHDMFPNYLEAFGRAQKAALSRMEKISAVRERPDATIYTGTTSPLPHFRHFTAMANIPEKIDQLRRLAYNLWWTWNPKALDLFARLDFNLWTEMGSNPVRMLETVSLEKLLEAAENVSYLNLYTQIMEEFEQYLNCDRVEARSMSSAEIRWSSPVAYFSTEYGFHESIPIYSGGLGVLSADHLKTASDLNLPLVGIGLLYKYGYFKQVVDKNGNQTAEYIENDFSNMPVQIVKDEQDEDVQISMEMPGRTLYANIWEIKVGRVTLYLLDTDVPRNTVQDRNITGRLYYADQKVRIEQEILLGMGGVKLLKKLGITPRAYHINEGHSAFLIFERISDMMLEEGLSFDEACEVVKNSTIFTTHTPVEAGNERFSKEMMEHYFASFVRNTGISWSQFLDLGRKDAGDDKPFFLTILALKLSHLRNGVSRIHGVVSRHMWRDVWKGFHDSDIPISHITNGAHVLSYLAPRMAALLEAHLGADWKEYLADPERWGKINSIPDNILWRMRYELKQKTIDFLHEHISSNWGKMGYSKSWQEEIFANINPAALFIGFARRFAPYKRADLIFSDLDRLDRIVNSKTRPVHIIIAGKAHPNDEMGKAVLKKVVDICRDARFRGKVIFIEDYNIRVARHLLQGVDVWLNTPRRPYEASGTSGEKATINGVLNLSISDGWWVEGYDGANGWTIGPQIRHSSEDTINADNEDAESLYSLLENTIVPQYYDRGPAGIPEKWIQMVKRSMQSIVPRFNTNRMLSDYYDQMYLPTARRAAVIAADSYRLARELSDWKKKIHMRFSSLRLIDVAAEGIKGDTVTVDSPLVFTARIDPGNLSQQEILVELILGKKDGDDFLINPICLPLEMVSAGDQGILNFRIVYKVPENGTYSYGIRVIPVHPDLASKEETGLIIWA